MSSPLDSSAPLAHELEVAIRAARAAADAILGFYNAHTADIYTKGDGSPVTDADLAADNVIREVLSASFPKDALLTEEGESDSARLSNPRVWIVDPIDGTAEYVAGTGRFDVLIALAIDNRPALAVTLQPTTGLMHAAVAGQGAWRCDGSSWTPFRLDEMPDPPRIVSSKWYRGREGRDVILDVASRVGAAEPPILEVGFQPRAFDPAQTTYDAFLGLWHPSSQSIAREWDIASSDLIVNEAGGRMTDLWGRRHTYNKQDTHITGGLIISASRDLHARILEALAPHLPAYVPAPDPAADDIATP